MIPGFPRRVRRAVPQGLALVAAAATLAGCVGSPTYGTGKPADVQLLEDVTGVLSLAPKDTPPIDYKPRPELVKPATASALPATQDPVTASAGGAWPESPEQTRARMRAEATLGRDDLDFRPDVVDSAVQSRPAARLRRTRGDDVGLDGSTLVEGSGSEQRGEFNRRLRESNQGSADSRRFLSEPPVTYRKPAETAAAGDVGEDEWRKQRRREANARKGESWSLGDLWPF